VAAEPQTGIITGEKLTKAAGRENSDSTVAAEFVAAEVAGDHADAAAADGWPGLGGTGHDGDGSQDEQDPPAWYADSAYGTGDLRDAIDAAGHRAVIKPKPLHPPVAGGFTVDDFTVSEERSTVTCPAGQTVTLSRTRIATFGIRCRDCPPREQCTTCKTGRRLFLHPP
jgi:hypothetical protein